MGSRNRNTRGKSRPPEPKAPPRREWVVPALLFGAALLVYLPIAACGFVWDDESSIQLNPLLRSVSGLWQIWTTIGQVPDEAHYWPLTYTFLWLGWHGWGDWAAGYHVLSAALHGLIAVQIWRLARRLALPCGWLVALIFALHPVHVESVAWATSIKDLTSTLFYLCAVELYVIYTDRGAGKWLALACAAAAAAMLCKSMPVTLPAGLAILTWYRRGGFAKKEIAALILIAAITVTIAVLDSRVASLLPNIQSVPGPPAPARLMQSGWNFWMYAWKLAWPFNLSVIYPQWDASVSNPLAWLPLVGAIVVMAALWMLRGRIGRGAFACWLFYGVTLAPVLGIVFFNFLKFTPVADRYQYLASLGPIAGAGVLASGWMKREPWRVAAAACVLVALATGTWRYAQCFHDDGRLFGRAVVLAPESAEAHYNLGTWYMSVGRAAEAEREFREAVRIEPGKWTAVCNLTSILTQQGRDKETFQICQEAIARNCDDPGVLSNLATVLVTTPDPALRNLPRGLELAERCARVHDKNEPIYLNILAQAQLAVGRRAEALVTARKALAKAHEWKADGIIPNIEATVRLAEKAQ